jgi:hypothetical protein
MQYYMLNMHNMHLEVICKICKIICKIICRICNQYADIVHIAVCWHQYAKYAKLYAKYAKYANTISICRICTPHFADVAGPAGRRRAAAEPRLHHCQQTGVLRLLCHILFISIYYIHYDTIMSYYDTIISLIFLQMSGLLFFIIPHLESATPGQEWTFSYVPVHTSTWWYKTVRTDKYLYIQVHTGMYQNHNFQNSTYMYVLYLDTISYFVQWGCNMLCKQHRTTVPCTSYDIMLFEVKNSALIPISRNI